MGHPEVTHPPWTRVPIATYPTQRRSVIVGRREHGLRPKPQFLTLADAIKFRHNVRPRLRTTSIHRVTLVQYEPNDPPTAARALGSGHRLPKGRPGRLCGIAPATEAKIWRFIDLCWLLEEKDDTTIAQYYKLVDLLRRGSLDTCAAGEEDAY